MATQYTIQVAGETNPRGLFDSYRDAWRHLVRAEDETGRRVYLLARRHPGAPFANKISFHNASAQRED